LSGLQVEIDPAHGGRWTSLVAANGREWLWRRDATERKTVRPGDPFVDAGGIEECYPTIGGEPDHGHVWSRPWLRDGDGLRVRGDDFEFSRSIRIDRNELTARYRLVAPTGQRFIWAAHAMLDLSTTARVELPPGRAMSVDLPDRSETAHWPRFGDVDLSVFGPSNGTVMGIRIPDLSEATVIDRDDRLAFRLEVDRQPTGIMLWRNLGGWPETAPYRSTGIEPMIGHRATLANAGPGQSGVVPASGEVCWALTIRVTPNTVEAEEGETS
jgi:hypothetical protein